MIQDTVAQRIRMKLEQVYGFMKSTRTPVRLSLDTLGLWRWPLVGVAGNGAKLKIRSHRGESFTFYENLVRRDYLHHGITINRGDTVVDIGANIGSFTVLAASLKAGRVIAYEPDPEIFKLLQSNVKLNLYNAVTTVNEAVGGVSGTLDFLKSNRSSASGLAGTMRVPGVIETIKVKVRSINDAIDDAGGNIALLKVDCEGSEYDIFDAMTPDRAAKIKQVAIEVHPLPDQGLEGPVNRLTKRMTTLGFKPFQVNDIVWGTR